MSKSNKLSDKAKGISFDDVDEPTSAAQVPQVERPRTAIGAISASLALGRGIEVENRELKAQLLKYEGAGLVASIDPKLIGPSKYANRHSLSFDTPEFHGLKEEIAAARGNVQPIKVRPIKGAEGSAAKYEIVFGHRRHRACLDLSLPVLAIVEEMPDTQLFAEMDRENRERQDLSPWEQGVMYKRALDSGLFQSQRQLAAAIGAHSGNVSTAIQLASLPPEVVAAFASPLVLQYRWAGSLASVLERDRDSVISRANELSALSPKAAPKDVFDRLTGVHDADREAVSRQFMVSGKAVGFLDKDKKGRVTVRLKAGALSEGRERRLFEFLDKLFD